MESASTIGYETLLNNVTSQIIVIDDDTKEILYTNKAFQTTLNTTGDLKGKYIQELRDEDATGKIASFLDLLLQADENKRDAFCPRIEKWFSIYSNKTEWGDCKNAKAYYAYDVTNRLLSADTEKKKAIAFETASKHLDVVIWEYDKQTHSIKVIQNPKDSYTAQAKVPVNIENAPYSLLPYIDEQYVDKFIELYTTMDNGAKYAEADIMLKSTQNISPRFEHFIMSSFRDSLFKEKIVCLGINITATKSEEEKYSRLKKHFDDVMEISYETALLDIGKNLCYEHHGVNNAVVKKHESTSADGFIYAVGMDISDPKLQTEFFEKFSVEAMRLNFIKGVQQMNMEFPTVENEFGMKWIRINFQLSYNPSKTSIEALTYMIDITEEKKQGFIVQALASSSAHYIGFLYLDKGTIDFFSNSIDIYFMEDHSEINNYSKLRDMRVRSFIKNEEDAKSYLMQSDLEKVKQELYEKDIYTFSFSQTVNGEDIRLQAHFSWISKEIGLVLLMVMNITDSYKKELHYLAELKKALMNAELASASKMDFISRISHDIRTPLSAITSMTNFAFEDIDDKVKLRNDLEKINSSNHFLMSLINDVLDVSKIDSGKIELIPEEYLYKDFIEDVKNMFEPLCEEKGIEFKTISEVLPITFIVDKVRFNQIVLNIISNSYKYTKPQGSITMVVKQEFIGSDKVNTDITISDTGIGMGKEFQEKMFVPFSQDLENPERQKLRSGTGLGLYIVKKLINLMGGNIEVTSELGKGTSMHFNVVTPYVECKDNNTKEDLQARKKLTGRILLAEDNEINTEIAIRTLTGMGLELDTAENGAIALKRFEESEPGRYIAILMDIQMPILSGYEATQAIRSLNRPDAKTIPIFALSANAFSEAVKQAYEAGMNGHISKPINTNILYRCLTEVVENQK